MKRTLNFSLKGLFILLTVFNFFSKTNVAYAQASYSGYDQGFIQGLEVATAAVAVYTTGYGNIDYHIRAFEVRRDLANRIANLITVGLDSVQNPLLKSSLEEIANDIKSAPQKGYGTLDYWIGMLGQQDKVLKRVDEKLMKLSQLVVVNRTVTHEKELGFLKGLNAAAYGIAEYTSGYGNIDYHIHTFELRRNVANKVARKFEEESKNVMNPLIKMALNELSKDILSAPQKGYGDIDYWVEVNAQQNRVLKRVSEKMSTLVNTIEKASVLPAQTIKTEGPASCRKFIAGS